MDYEQELKRLAQVYASQGYAVFLRPGPENLPPFARDFKVEILGKRGTDGGVLVKVKKNREDLQADPDMSRYAEMTSEQPGWRFDFVVLQQESELAREVRGAKEPSLEDLVGMLNSGEDLGRKGFVNPALLTAWAGLEAAMRRMLRAVKDPAGWGTQPRVMMNELFSNGTFSSEEFRQLEGAWRLRNEIVHGFATPVVDPRTVQFLVDTAKRLVAESQSEKQPA